MLIGTEWASNPQPSIAMSRHGRRLHRSRVKRKGTNLYDGAMDTFERVFAFLTAAMMTWGLIGVLAFALDDVWPFKPHSIRWLPGGYGGQ